MRIHELYTNLLDEALQEDFLRLSNHTPWMAELITNLPRDPAYKKLKPELREQIETIVAGIE